MSVAQVRGRFLFREVNERGFDLPLGSVTKDGGVEFRSDLDISVWNPGDDTSGYKRVLPGDFVIGLRSFQSGIGSSAIETIVSPAYTVLRPVSDRVHGGYFKHLFKSTVYVSRLENVAQGIRQGRTIATEDFYNIELPLPPLTVQRAIADYLDAETARIDALIAKKQTLLRVLAERRIAAIDDAVGRCQASLAAVRRLSSRITSGPRGWAAFVADSGTPFIRITNVQRNSIELDMRDTLLVDAPPTPESDRTRVRAGDVLVSITADIGSVGVVPGHLSGANISQHIALVRPAGCEPDWLAYAIRSTPARAQLDAGQYGGTKTQLSLEDIASLRVPLPDLGTQRALTRELRSDLRSIDQCVERVQRQLELLAEHRQALITSAVTGQITVPGAA